MRTSALCVASFSLLLIALAVPARATVLYRVNVGGPELAAADASSPAWQADTQAAPSPFLANPGSGGLFSQSPVIDLSDSSLTPAVPAALFQTERWDDGAVGDPLSSEMQWAFAIASGTTVEVRLYLAEIFDGIAAIGDRVFDVAVEGAVPAAFSGIDQFALSGEVLNRGIMLATTVTVNDGTLNLDFLHGVENPAVKGIELVVVPEPGVAALIGLGLAGLALRARHPHPD